MHPLQSQKQSNIDPNFPRWPRKNKVIFLLGAPGSGKGTECQKLVEDFGYEHLSAGDLLREERSKTDSQYSELIENHIKNGTIVPVEITCRLIERAMRQIGGRHLPHWWFSPKQTTWMVGFEKWLTKRSCYSFWYWSVRCKFALDDAWAEALVAVAELTTTPKVSKKENIIKKNLPLQDRQQKHVSCTALVMNNNSVLARHVNRVISRHTNVTSRAHHAMQQNVVGDSKNMKHVNNYFQRGYVADRRRSSNITKSKTSWRLSTLQDQSRKFTKKSKNWYNRNEKDTSANIWMCFFIELEVSKND